jgi:hypothetical protein
MANKTLVLAAVLILGAAVAGCGSEIGDAPVVRVTPEQRDKDLNAEAESTVKWLEGLPQADRDAAVARTPQIASILKGASDPALKQRIEALGIKTKP